MRGIVWAMGGFVVVAIAVIGYTPLVPSLMPGIIRSDPLKPADAIVVLEGGGSETGEPSVQGRARLQHALELLHEGFGDRLVLTESNRYKISWVGPAVRYMRSLGLDYPVESAGRVSDTHD